MHSLTSSILDKFKEINPQCKLLNLQEETQETVGYNYQLTHKLFRQMLPLWWHLLQILRKYMAIFKQSITKQNVL